MYYLPNDKETINYDIMILDKKDFKFKWVKDEDYKIWTNLAIDVYFKKIGRAHV